MNNDLISRSALKEEMNRPFWEKWEWEYICKAIDNAPTFERPQGEKIKKEHYGWVYCSECDSLLGIQDNFCWNCGAKMKGGVDNG